MFVFGRKVKKNDEQVIKLSPIHQTFHLGCTKIFTKDDMKKIIRGHIPYKTGEVQPQDCFFFYTEKKNGKYNMFVYKAVWGADGRNMDFEPKFTMFFEDDRADVFAYCNTEAKEYLFKPHETIEQMLSEELKEFLDFYF